MTIQVFTDGSYNHIKKRGSWAFCIYSDAATVRKAGDIAGKRDRSSTTAEVLAVVKALQFIAKNPQLQNDADIWVHTDCESIVDAVDNYDYFPAAALHYETIFIWLVRQLRVRFRWIPRGINSEADRLARHQMRYGFIEEAEGASA